MCTIIAIFGGDVAPLIVAANRDEYVARAAGPTDVFQSTPRIVAGRDQVSGGTWFGATATGFFAGLTNQRGWTAPAASISRGAVVADILRGGSTDAALDHLATLDAGSIAAFNLLFGDSKRLHVAYARPDGVRIQELPPGIHVLANDELGSETMPKTRHAEGLAATLLDGPTDLPSVCTGLEVLLADESEPPTELVPKPPPKSALSHAMAVHLQRLCIDPVRFGGLYGTRSSNVLAIGSTGVLHHRTSDSIPTSHGFRDVTALYA